MKMKERPLQVLTLKIRNHRADDIALIFAEPSSKDVERMITETSLVDLIRTLLWADEFPEKVPAGGEENQTIISANKSSDVKLESELDNNNVGTDKLFNEEEGEAGGDNGAESDAMIDFFDSDFEEEDRQSSEKDKENEYDEPRSRRRKKINYQDVEEGSNFADLDFEKNGSEYCCKICSKLFKTEGNLQKHMKLHASNRVPEEDRTCPHCTKVFSSQSLMETHIKQICREMRDVSCDACQITFETGKLLEDHVRKEHGKGFKCDYCNYVAGIYRYKILHEKKLHLNMDCKICYKLFDTVEDRDSHKCVRPERFQCSQCDKNYKVKGELKKHIDIIHKGIKFPCNQCNDVLSSSQSLKRHIRTVHETLVKNFRCEICSKAFKDSDYLQRHMRTHEESTKSFVCQECGKFFKYKVTLKSHIRTMHEKIFKQTCEECGKCFPDMHKLKVHSEMVHMKGELFMCQICGKEMIGKNRLRNHMMTHPKGQKFVACEQCGKEVAETQLKSHIVQAHKMHMYKYPCDYCPKRLDTKAHIRAHIRKHTGARPYLCRGCNKYYPLLETAQKHTRIFHNSDYSLILYDITRDINNPYVNEPAGRKAIF